MAPLKNDSAPVKPRVHYSRNFIEPILLTDAIEKMLDSNIDSASLVGEGRTTAIEYLREYFSDNPRMRFLDEADEIDQGEWDLTVYTSPQHVARGHRLKLAKWNRDDCIEYLMSAAPTQCKSVMSRLLAADDLWLASGSPRVLAPCLDTMIEDPSIDSLEKAIEIYFAAKEFKRPRHRQRVIKKCLSHFFNSEKLALDLRPFAPRFIDRSTISFLAIQTIRYVLVSHKLIEELSRRRTPNCFQNTWTPTWTEYFANRLQSTGSQVAIEFLDQLANKVDNRNSANAASVMYQLDCNWRPSSYRRLNFENVQLTGIEANEFVLEDSLLTRSDFSNAALPFSSLKDSVATGSDFSNANLSHSNLELFVARHANFSSTNLRNVRGHKSDFSAANLSNSNLEQANFSKARFTKTDLSDTNLNSANFTETNLDHAVFEQATLEKTVFQKCSFEAAKLQDAVIANTQFLFCSMVRCNFEYRTLSNIKFNNCVLTSALFSSSKLDQCDLSNSKLIDAKLGDIVWTDCNLSGVDFAGCHFAYGSTRSGTVGSPYPSHGTRTGYYTDDYDDQYFKRVEEIRRAGLEGCDLTGADVFKADFYLVDLRGAKYDQQQEKHFQKCGAILTD